VNRLPSFDLLHADADRTRPRIAVAAAGGADATVLQALAEAQRRGWVQPTAFGDLDAMRRVAAEHAIPTEGIRLAASTQPAADAVAEIRAGRAQVLMKGQIATPELMKAVLQADTGLRTGWTLSQVVLMEIPRDGRSFLLADTGLCIAPTLPQKREILGSLVDTARGLGAAAPRVAVMSATEKASPSMPDTLEAVELSEAAARGERWEMPAAARFAPCGERAAAGTVWAHVEGPLSFDLAYAADAGDKKRLSGEVIGQADAMLFPNLLAANLTVKAIMYTADCRFGGVVRGASAPIVFMSRADSVETRINSIALALRLMTG